MDRGFNLNGKKGNIFLETDADLSVFEEVFVDRDYKILDDIIKRASVVLDIGGHIGCFSVYVGILNREARVFAFEPEERNFRMLKENLKINHIESVVAKNVAIGGISGDRDLYLSEDSHNHSLIGDGKRVVNRDDEGNMDDGVRFGNEKRVVKVFVRDFVGILKRFEKVDLVKMDIEGAEFEVFENLEMNDLRGVEAIYIEYHEGKGSESGEFKSSDDIKRFLEKAGFEVGKKASFYGGGMGFLFGKRG